MTASVTIALAADNKFELAIPSTQEGRTHMLLVPATEAGIGVIKKILSERKKTFARLEIGNPASPIQAMVDDWLRADRLARAEARKAADEAKEQKLLEGAKAATAGLDLGELDL